MKIPISISKACRLLATAIGLLLACAGANAGVVFQADFNGPGGGTGGPNDIVTLGGTGWLPDGVTGLTNTVIGTTPLSTNSGNYLETALAAGTYSGNLPAVTFTFAASNNCFEALQGPNVSSGGSSYTALNGAFDIFFRPNAFVAGDSGWFRPVDTISWNGGGSDGLRLIFNGDASGELVLEIVSLNGAAVTNFSATGGSAHSLTQALIYGGTMTTAGQIYHAGFTFNTDTNGYITMRMFLQPGTGAISTTNTPLNSATFRLNAAVVSNAFEMAPWNFTGSYANHSVAVNVDFDSVRVYDSDPGIFTALPAQLAASVPPIILKVSDGVAAGRSFSINGQGFYPTATNVAVAPDTTGQSPATPPLNAIYPAILQTDKDAHFIVASLPAGSSPGVYNVWVANSQGWSSCVKLNAARALFMSDYQAYSGLDIEVVGRNFDQSEFGGTTATQVRLNNGSGTTYNLPIKDLNPYHVTFTVGSQPVGTYYVEVSSDNGVNWSRLASGQTLTLLAVPPGNYDPLGLGVSWAKDFVWTNVFNVTNYGVNPNSTNDDTTAVQNAVNAAENSGGGVVYFPNGTYYIKTISLGAGVVLEGQDQYNTQLYYNATDGRNFINTKGTGSKGGIPQLQGVTRMSILLANPTNLSARPDMFIIAWETFGVPTLTTRRSGPPTGSLSSGST